MSRAPWFMTSVRKQIAEFFSPSRGRIFQLLASRIATMSPLGRLLVSKGHRDFIFNPLSRVSIELPSLEKLRHKSSLAVELDVLKKLRCGPNRIHKIALSSSPSSSRSYTAMISFHGNFRDHKQLGFAFLRSGEDAWTVVSPATHLHWSSVVGLIHYDGLFVALDAGSLLVAWKIKGENDGPVKHIRVFKVDLKKRTKKEVESLGNASFFLNYNSSFSVEFNAEYPESCFLGIKPNHIHFTDYMDEKKIYSMDDGKVETYLDATGCHRYAGQWFQPDF
ncbi:hypothetical protein NL676_008711 [Syzygium grande]|nr:hypothetical protein NL676_008711 [Syzygium grande]